MEPTANGPSGGSATRDDAPAALRAICWGTRGSIPSPGAATARFGGNTSCLEVRTGGGRRLLFDAGTGIRQLGERLARQPGTTDLDLFLTHFHWDHIQGLPFFSPLYREDTFIRIHAARQGELDIETLLKGQMGPVYFPVPYEALAASLTFEHLTGEPWEDSGSEIAAYRVRHAAHTCGYRVRSAGASLAYIPDNELSGSHYPVDGARWRAGLVRFLEGVDILFHDAMYTDEEYGRREGWGHSTFGQAVALAETAGVRRLVFFHHAPGRTDADLLGILGRVRADLDRRGSGLEVDLATEGEELAIPA